MMRGAGTCSPHPYTVAWIYHYLDNFDNLRITVDITTSHIVITIIALLLLSHSPNMYLTGALIQGRTCHASNTLCRRDDVAKTSESHTHTLSTNKNPPTALCC